MLLGQPAGLDVFIEYVDVVIVVFDEQKEDGRVAVAVIHGQPVPPFLRRLEWFDDVYVVAEVVEELTGCDLPVAVAVGAQFPAGVFFEFAAVVLVDGDIVVDGGGDEAGVGFLLLAMGVNEVFFIPGVADSAGVGGGVDAGAEDAAGAVGVAEGAVLGFGEGGGFLDEDDIVFEAEVQVEVVFGADVTDDDAGVVGEGEDSGGAVVFVVGFAQKFASEVVELFAGLFGVFAEVKGFEAGLALAVVEGELGEGGVGFTGAACAAEAELGGAVGVVAGAGGGVEAQLLGEGYVGEVMEAGELVFGTAGGACLEIEAGQVVRIGVIHQSKLPQGVFDFLHRALRARFG